MNDYERIKILGNGGMGKVWLVRDRNTLQKWAMKEIPRTAYVGEAGYLLMLHHEGIPRMVKQFEDENHTYMMMEFIDGITLSEYIQQYGVASTKDVLDYMLQLLKILRYVHDKNIIYCDIKPENIMLCKNGKIYLIDFGSAVPKNCQDPIHYGTIGYAAPEQYVEKPVDERVDIYGVGKVAIALLSGVYNGEQLQSIEISQMSLSKSVSKILTTCLYEEREKRYKHVQYVIHDIITLTSKTSWTHKVCYKIVHDLVYSYVLI